MHQDNLGAIYWTTEVQGQRRVKHIGIKYQYVRDAVEDKVITVQCTISAMNRADSLTKALKEAALASTTGGWDVYQGLL